MKTLFVFCAIFLSHSGFAMDDTACATPQGRQALAREYSGPVPSCGPQCSLDFILASVCDGERVRPSCYTEPGRNLIIRDYVESGKPVPACGPQCAHEFILSLACAEFLAL